MPPETTDDETELGYPANFNVEAFAEDFGVALLMVTLLEERMRQFLAVVNAAHNVGWIVDPTRYRDMQQRNGNMDDLAALVRLALPLAEQSRELRERILSRHVAAGTTEAGT